MQKKRGKKVAARKKKEKIIVVEKNWMPLTNDARQIPGF